MDVYYSFNYLSAGWMILEAVPLILTPTMIITLLSPEVRESTVLEEYLSRSLGMVLIAFAILNLLLTGSVPLTSSLSEPASHATSTDLSDPTAPYAVPSLTITFTYHCAVAFYCYTMYAAGHALTFGISVVAHALFAAIGGWVMMFGASNGLISRKTGADGGEGTVSSFPFKNNEAEIKKQQRPSKKAL